MWSKSYILFRKICKNGRKLKIEIKELKIIIFNIWKHKSKYWNSLNINIRKKIKNILIQKKLFWIYLHVIKIYTKNIIKTFPSQRHPHPSHHYSMNMYFYPSDYPSTAPPVAYQSIIIVCYVCIICRGEALLFTGLLRRIIPNAWRCCSPVEQTSMRRIM